MLFPAQILMANDNKWICYFFTVFSTLISAYLINKTIHGILMTQFNIVNLIAFCLYKFGWFLVVSN